MAPLAIDLFCGLGGWTEGLLAEGYFVIGFDIERHEYGDHRYPGNLVLQDVLSLHGGQFKDAALIVASPPCQAYSYRAMPWKRAKALPPPDNALFEACFRIQREACEAAGRHVPLIVENVRGAQKWVGRARWNYGSFYLWGDVPALMPSTFRAQKFNPDGTSHGQGSWFAIADSKNRGTKVSGLNWSRHGEPDYKGEGFNTHADRRLREEGVKSVGPSRAEVKAKEAGYHWTNPAEWGGRKVGGDWFSGYGGGFGWDRSPMRQNNSKSPARKHASAMIAKIPMPLSRYIARTFIP